MTNLRNLIYSQQNICTKKLFLAVDVLGCQQYCDQIYEQKCTFFIFDYKQELCDLFDFLKEDFINSCNRVGGPTTPDIATCSNQDVIDADECIVSIKTQHVLNYRDSCIQILDSKKCLNFSN